VISSIVNAALGFAIVVTLFAGLSFVTFLFLSLDLHREINRRRR
jgi:hypothetical protein